MITLESVNTLQERALELLQALERGEYPDYFTHNGTYRYLTDNLPDPLTHRAALVHLCECRMGSATQETRLLFLAFLVTLPTADLLEMLS